MLTCVQRIDAPSLCIAHYNIKGPYPELAAKGGGKGGCTHDYGCNSYTGGAGRHGGGGGAKDYDNPGMGGGASLCPGKVYKFAQDGDKSGIVIDRLKFNRFTLGGGASAGGGGGAAHIGKKYVGTAIGNGGYRGDPNQGGGDGGKQPYFFNNIFMHCTTVCLLFCIKDAVGDGTTVPTTEHAARYYPRLGSSERCLMPFYSHLY